MYSKKRIETILSNLAKNWNGKYWLFAAGGGLYLMKYNEDGNRILDGTSVSQKAIIKKFEIDADGGDW